MMQGIGRRQDSEKDISFDDTKGKKPKPVHIHIEQGSGVYILRVWYDNKIHYRLGSSLNLKTVMSRLPLTFIFTVCFLIYDIWNIVCSPD